MEILASGNRRGYFKQFKRLDEVLQKLESDGHLELMQNLLKSIYESTVIPGITSIKDPLKVIFNHLIDKTWKKPEKQNEGVQNFGGIKLSAKAQNNRKSIKKVKSNSSDFTFSKLDLRSRQSTESNYPTKSSHRNDTSSIMQDSYSFLKAQSTFSRQKRDFNYSVPQTPGPGNYAADSLKFKSSTVTSTIPKSGSRMDFLSTEISPGPGHYTPRLNFVSK